jgi:SHS2 domain-containing protein
MHTDGSLMAQIVRRVDIEELARRMVAVFQAEIPAYSTLPETMLHGEIEEVSRRNLGLFFRSLIDDRGLSDEELVPFCESARQRAAEGLPLEDLLRAYRLGGRLGWEALVGVAEPEEQATLLPGVARLMQYVDHLSDAVTEAYQEERRHLFSDAERRVHDLFEGLQHTAPLEPRTIELADQMGFPLDDRYLPFTLALCDSPAHAHAQLASSLRRRGVLAVTSGDRVSGLLPQSGDPATLAEGSGLRAVGPPTPRAELAPMLVDLRLLIDVARRAGREGDLRLEEFLPELLLARSPHLGAMLEERVYGPLVSAAEKGGADLLTTLEAFLEAGLDRRATADALHVHPNTLDYRLRRTEELTGLLFADPDAVMLLALAVRRRRLEQPAGTPVS